VSCARCVLLLAIVLLLEQHTRKPASCTLRHPGRGVSKNERAGLRWLVSPAQQMADSELSTPSLSHTHTVAAAQSSRPAFPRPVFKLASLLQITGSPLVLRLYQAASTAPATLQYLRPMLALLQSVPPFDRSVCQLLFPIFLIGSIAYCCIRPRPASTVRQISAPPLLALRSLVDGSTTPQRSLRGGVDGEASLNFRLPCTSSSHRGLAGLCAGFRGDLRCRWLVGRWTAFAFTRSFSSTCLD